MTCTYGDFPVKWLQSDNIGHSDAYVEKATGQPGNGKSLGLRKETTQRRNRRLSLKKFAALMQG